MPTTIAPTWFPAHPADAHGDDASQPLLPRTAAAVAGKLGRAWRSLTCRHTGADSYAAGPAQGQSAAAAIKGIEGLAHILDGTKTHRKHIMGSRAEQQHMDHLSNNHTPEVLVIECSDARYSAAKTLNTKTGQLFEYKTLGAIVPKGAGPESLGLRAAIQYGTVALGVTRIIVLGHTGCGMVKAMLDPAQAKSLADTSAYIALMADLRQSIDARFAFMNPDQRALAAVGEAVLFSKRQVEALPYVRDNNVEVYAMVYELSNYGLVSLYDEDTDEYAVMNALRPSDKSQLPRRNPAPPTTAA